MKRKEYEQLKLGDVVSPYKGKNKGRKAVVTFIWDLVDSDKYNEIIIFGIFLDGENENCSYNYRNLRVEQK